MERVWTYCRKRRAWLVFGVALLARLAWVTTLDEHLAWYDEEEYVAIAHHLAAGDGFVASSYRSHPVLPSFLAASFALFGDSYLPARVGQGLLGALTCVLVSETAVLLAGPVVGLVGGMWLALYPPHIYLSGVFYVEALFMLFASLAIYLAVRWVTRGQGVGTAIGCGASCALAILTRPVFAVYMPFLCLALLYASWPRWRLAVGHGIVLLLTTAAMILPWTLRNYAVFGRVIPVSTGFYTLFWQGNNELADGGPDDRFLFWNLHDRYWGARLDALPDADRQRIVARYDAVERDFQARRHAGEDFYMASDATLKPIILEYVAAHPLRFAELAGRKLVTLYSAFSGTYMTNQSTTSLKKLLSALAFYPMLMLALVGAWMARRENPGFAVVYLFIASMSVAYAAIAACTRYRLPLDPYLIVLASFALVRGVVQLRQPVQQLTGASAPVHEEVGLRNPT